MKSATSLDLYFKMLIEEALAERYKKQTMRCPVHLSRGQERIAVGISEIGLYKYVTRLLK